MSRGTIIIITLVAYKLVLIAMGIWASKRTKDTGDFYLGGRTLGPVVAAISASASSSSAWTLLGVSGFAYKYGLSSIWLFPACVGGFILNWYFVAPRLRTYSEKTDSLTLTEAITHNTNPKHYIAVVASVIITFSLLFYVSSQFQAAGKTFSETFDISYTSSVLIGGAIIIFYTMIGGFWAVSLTDTLQGMLMALSAVVLPLVALYNIGGFSGLFDSLSQIKQSGYLNLIQGMPLASGIGFVIGLLGIGLGYPGQPHVVNRFMALKDDQALAKARRIAVLWAVIVYGGMILLGLCGRGLYESVGDKEKIFFVITNKLFHPVVAGLITASILSAIMSTADSQLLVAASSATHDLKINLTGNPLLEARVVVFILSISSMLLAIFGPDEIFQRVLFAWSAMGSALGPILVVRLWKGPIASKATLMAMLCGFVFSVVAYSFPQTKGTFYERVLPFVFAFCIALYGTQKQHKKHV